MQSALLVATRLEKLFDRIARAPGIGHRRKELGDETLRVIEASGYLVIYDPTLKPLHILRVARGLRDLRRLNPRPRAREALRGHGIRRLRMRRR